MFVEGDASARIERHSFRFEQTPLQFVRVAAGSGADFAMRVDHAMPRNANRRGKSVQRVTDLARVTLEPGKIGNLAIGGDATAGNLSHGLVDS